MNTDLDKVGFLYSHILFRKEDFALIKSSPAMFARKFNLTVDGDIVDMVLHSIK